MTSRRSGIARAQRRFSVVRRALNSFRFWTVGNLATRKTSLLLAISPLIIGGLIAALALGGPLNRLSLGADIAVGLGQHVTRTRIFCLVVVVVRCGTATAMAAPNAFVGLAIPHIVRKFVGADNGKIIVLSIALGPVLLIGADVLGRVIARPGELDVGIVVALIGAPLFIVLVRRMRRRTT